MSEADLIMPVRNGEIRIHDEAGFEGMRKAGRLVAECLDMLVPEVKPGVTTAHLDHLIREFVYDHGAQSATIGYRGYRHASCISLNHVICHGIPGDRPLKDGDIANIDVTVIVNGWHGDHSRMYAAGTPKRKAERLMDVTYESLMAGIAAVKPGNRFGDIGAAISKIAAKNRLSVVEDFCGHGLGQLFHDEPNVVHSARAGTGPELKPGMFFTIEPMLNIGRKDAAILPDGWTAVTRDRQLSAQFEHSVGVTEDGVEIFTSSPKGWHTPHTVEL
ncbi:type I methionyl aminopeptidase [Henriciella algicola]|uniref:Methionine aminopeptidase n=1 Tax=Henriciella algicola TaxID=1608422 RepID=A0A399RPW4_9PROT|nr:type I methionyl aminopeptidase [Henriciella algicola]RIJ33238.1 type I methionyl aminopeptidase [Henriciella algicola]